jgi:probable FeS assembly SUF system protein SufT
MFGGSGEERVTLSRDCPAIEVPSGDRIVLPAGSGGVITQSLGGTFSVITDQGFMVRIAGADADAIGKAAEAGAGPEAPASEAPEDVEKAVWDQLRTVYDPEIPINLADLGLVYGCRVNPLDEGGNRVEIEMTLTAPGCGMGDVLKAEVESKVERLPGVKELDVQLVLDPPWDFSMIPDAAKLTLGMM